jgi:hypothetical protein
MLQQILQPGDEHVRPPAKVVIQPVASRTEVVPADVSHVSSDHERVAAGAASLDAIGVRYGTELSSRGRNCLVQWERFLAPFRDQPIDVLEIGIGNGASLRTWRAWFPRARLAGLDARRVALHPGISGCTNVQGNQTDLGAFQPLLRAHHFRVVIDDGSRHADDQIQTFLMLFPWLGPGAVYICAGFEGGSDFGRTQDHAVGERGFQEDPTAPNWFAGLGSALARNAIHEWNLGNHPGGNLVLQNVNGVFLMRGSVVVTSRYF